MIELLLLICIIPIVLFVINFALLKYICHNYWYKAGMYDAKLNLYIIGNTIPIVQLILTGILIRTIIEVKKHK